MGLSKKKRKKHWILLFSKDFSANCSNREISRDIRMVLCYQLRFLGHMFQKYLLKQCHGSSKNHFGFLKEVFSEQFLKKKYLLII